VQKTKKLKLITPTQDKFIEVYSKTGDATLAARRAGYAAPHVEASRIMRHSGVGDLARAKHAKFILEEGLPLANAALNKILISATSADRDKVSAARLIYAEVKSILGISPDKEVHEMTADELAAMQDKLSAEIDKHMRDVTPIDDAQVVQPDGVFG
jgi:phage terminase small subunit